MIYTFNQFIAEEKFNSSIWYNQKDNFHKNEELSSTKKFLNYLRSVFIPLYLKKLKSIIGIDFNHEIKIKKEGESYIISLKSKYVNSKNFNGIPVQEMNKLTIPDKVYYDEEIICHFWDDDDDILIPNVIITRPHFKWEIFYDKKEIFYHSFGNLFYDIEKKSFNETSPFI